MSQSLLCGLVRVSLLGGLVRVSLLGGLVRVSLLGGLVSLLCGLVSLFSVLSPSLLSFRVSKGDADNFLGGRFVVPAFILTGHGGPRYAGLSYRSHINTLPGRFRKTAVCQWPDINQGKHYK